MPTEELNKAPDAYVKELVHKEKIIQELAKQNVKDVQKVNKERYDKKTKGTTISDKGPSTTQSHETYPRKKTSTST